jgi:hypothetical protein
MSVLSLKPHLSTKNESDMKDCAILYKRMSTNLAEVLMPVLYSLDETDSEIKRIIKIV